MAKDFLTEAFLSLKDRWKAEDALQEAFCRLWGRKYKAASLKEAVGLLSKTGRNIEIDEYRRSKRGKTVALDGIVVVDEGGSCGEMESLFRMVEASVDMELSTTQKEIIRMHEYEGMTFENIADELGMAPAAVRMQASRARKLLREKFREDYE
ncbi:MAG: sigma-70 family RNA polymerase sigma factor [Bacteroidales bacterium]|nr:sigma-70 family RNA polymerase sigma factor [Bacteroidales bacterium]